MNCKDCEPESGALLCMQHAMKKGGLHLKHLAELVSEYGGVYGDGKVKLDWDGHGGTLSFALEGTDVMFCTPDWDGVVGIQCQVFSEDGDMDCGPVIPVVWASDWADNVTIFRALVTGAAMAYRTKKWAK